MESLEFSYIVFVCTSSDSFTSSFLIWMAFYIFLVWLLWLGHPIQYWIKVAKVWILDLLLILEEKFSACHGWELCDLWIFHIWPLLCWGNVPSICILLEVFDMNGYWILSNAFSTSIKKIIWFLHSVNIVYHVHWFTNVETFLYP